MADSTIKSVFVCLASVSHQILVNQIALSEVLAKELPEASEESRRMLVKSLQHSNALCGLLDDVGPIILRWTRLVTTGVHISKAPAIDAISDVSWPLLGVEFAGVRATS